MGGALAAHFLKWPLMSPTATASKACVASGGTFSSFHTALSLTPSRLFRPPRQVLLAIHNVTPLGPPLHKCGGWPPLSCKRCGLWPPWPLAAAEGAAAEVWPLAPPTM